MNNREIAEKIAGLVHGPSDGPDFMEVVWSIQDILNEEVDLWYGATMSGYQLQAHATSRNTSIGGFLVYPALGLAGEAGEVANKIKKIYRDKGGQFDDDDTAQLAGELGDVLWYIAELCTQLGLSMDGVADLNIAKLQSRARRGVIEGDGDNR